MLAKALAHANGSALLGGYLKAGGGGPVLTSLGGYVFALVLNSTTNERLGAYVLSRRERSAFLGGYAIGTPSGTRFVEAHARVLAKANSDNAVGQSLNVDAKVIFMGQAASEFNAQFILYRQNFSEFNAQTKVTRYYTRPTTAIVTVQRLLNPGESGLSPMPNMGPSGYRRVQVTVSGGLGTCPEWIHGYIDFGEPARGDAATLDASISGFTGNPPWTAYHDYAVSGIYMITARGQDNCGQVAMDVYRLQLASGLTPGVHFPAISISGLPRSGEVPESLMVQYSLVSSGVFGVASPTDANLYWNFGNRETSRKKNPRTYYNSPGLYAGVARFRHKVGNGKYIWAQDSLLIGYNI